LGGRAFDLVAWTDCIIAFVALGLTCSATYLVNDLWDLEHDRQHPTKRLRPIASGELTKFSAVTAAIVTLFVGAILAASLDGIALGVLFCYVMVSLSYSFFLKRFPIVDVLVIASLFTLRLVLGVVVTGVRWSAWLLVFSMFAFVSLSLAKRYTELKLLTSQGRASMGGRGYLTVDAPLVLGFGVAAGLGSVLVIILYLIEEAFPVGFYKAPQYLWALPGILFLFLGRIWMVAQRGELNDDPVEYALKDRQSLLYAITALVALVAALL
jgi:4-hydroxybenzoate polyprenyltransferase